MSGKMVYSCLIFLLISFIVPAQKLKFNSVIMGGVSIGQSGSYGLVQIINGVNYKNWFTGIGVGIDYYKNESIPLFADIKVFIPKTNLFIFADPGYNFPYKNKADERTPFYNSYRLKGGFYSELGVGYKINLTRKTGLLFTAGYSYKKLNDKVSTCPDSTCLANYRKYEYEYRRIQLKAGFTF